MVTCEAGCGSIGGAVVDPVYGQGGTEQVRHLKKNLDFKA